MKRLPFIALWLLCLTSYAQNRPDGSGSKPSDGIQIGGWDGTKFNYVKIAADGSLVTSSGGGSGSSLNIITTSTPSTYTVTTTSGQAMAANASRLDATFTNTSSVWVYGARGATAVVGSGIALGPNGGSYNMNADNLYRGALNFITATGTANLAMSQGQ